MPVPKLIDWRAARRVAQSFGEVFVRSFPVGIDPPPTSHQPGAGHISKVSSIDKPPFFVGVKLVD